MSSPQNVTVIIYLVRHILIALQISNKSESKCKMDNMEYYEELTISLKTLQSLISTIKGMFQIKTFLRMYISDLSPNTISVSTLCTCQLLAIPETTCRARNIAGKQNL